jgi:hypothetical protein
MYKNNNVPLTEILVGTIDNDHVAMIKLYNSLGILDISRSDVQEICVRNYHDILEYLISLPNFNLDYDIESLIDVIMPNFSYKCLEVLFKYNPEQVNNIIYRFGYG